MTEWIDFKKQQPTQDYQVCWVMNYRRGAYGYVALWYKDMQIFQLNGDRSESSPALDVTHWYPLPSPFWRIEDA